MDIGPIIFVIEISLCASFVHEIFISGQVVISVFGDGKGVAYVGVAVMECDIHINLFEVGGDFNAPPVRFAITHCGFAVEYGLISGFGVHMDTVPALVVVEPKVECDLVSRSFSLFKGFMSACDFFMAFVYDVHIVAINRRVAGLV